MTLRQSVQMANNLPSIASDGYEPAAVFGDFIVPASLAAGDVIEMGIIPMGYVPLSAKAVFDRVDSNGAPTLTFDCGQISGLPYKLDNARTCGNEAFAAAAVGRAVGGDMQQDNKPDWSFLPPQTTLENGVSFGLKVVGAPATLVVGARIRLTIFIRPMLNLA
jgi:hypothetical protein